ncbi:glycoside hydrolase superfamily [Thelonectria olida]|uniref:Glycoside hydrolase superfamily n=1 Tax=Thelonectria olida TaxID=1576542 RepID=A0A9P8W144_9HYPO|nr:glycoside hydrolase superfamily [Thelonectria olida]
MAILKTFVSALSLAAVGAAIPAHMHQRQNPPTTTLYSVTTITQIVNAPAATAPYSTTSNTKPNSQSTHDDDSESVSEAVTLPGVAYAPYRGDNGCKTPQQVEEDLEQLKDKYGLIRIYGTDCDQVANIHDAAKKSGIKKLFLGIWNINDVANEAQKIVDGIDGDWGMVDTVSVGNELVNNGAASSAQVIAAVKQARSILRGAGYNGPVVTVDTFVAVTAHPELCEASDYCAINAHAFFDSTITAEQAGAWLKKTVESVKSAVGGKKVVVTESGWPHKGLSNGLAVPGSNQQLEALTSIKKAFSNNLGDLILFSAFNCPWKAINAATFDAEPYWGIDGLTAKSDI